MKKRTRLSALLALFIFELATASQAVWAATINFAGQITFAEGPFSSYFQTGDFVGGSYSVNPSSPDLNADPRTGFYGSGSLVDLTVVFGSGLHFSHTSGPWMPIIVYNDASIGFSLVSDQLMVTGSTRLDGSLLAGHEVEVLEVDFLRTLMSPSVPQMLTSDAIPLSPLSYDSGILQLTVSGYDLTYMYFSPIPEPSVLSLLLSSGVLVAVMRKHRPSATHSGVAPNHTLQRTRRERA